MTLFSHDTEFSDRVLHPARYKRHEQFSKLPERCGKAWKTYTGQRKPRCNGGEGCQACWAIYGLKHPDFSPSPTIKW